MRSAATYLFPYIIQSFRVQLYLFLVSIPILAAWGLPVTIAAFIGNILFAPFITIFLGISLWWLIFYYSNMPLSWISYLLESVVSSWISLLSIGSDADWYMFVPTMPPLVLIGFFLVIIFVFLGRALGCYGIRCEIICLSFFISIGLLLRSVWAQGLPCSIGYGSRDVVLVRSDSGIYLVDDRSTIRNGRSLSYWVRANFLHGIADAIPSEQITYFLLPNPTPSRLAAAQEIIRSGKIGYLMVPAAAVTKWFVEWWRKQQGTVRVIIASQGHVDHIGAIVRAYRFDKRLKGCNTKTGSLV